MRLVVGLGNPGAEYEATRHNLGFMLVDRLASEAGAAVKRKDCRSLVGRATFSGETVELVKPQTYMNLSGEAVACLIGKAAGFQPGRDLVVISDDLALPIGRIRIRPRGSAGGHNGLKSIIECCKTDEFIRVRIGMLPEHPVSDTRRFVLENFSKTERVELPAILDRAAEAVQTVLIDGVERAMAKFN
jgi:PTH1 family peptidyl-tRNA hydrolase